MIQKRKFGKRGSVAVLMCSDARADKDLMKRVDAAAQQFGITQEYAFDYFMSDQLHDQRHLYVALMEQALVIVHRGYKALITVGPEAEAAINLLGRLSFDECMIIGVNTRDALEAKAPYQFEMRNPHKHFSANLSPLVQTCLQKNLSQEDGVAYVRLQEEQRQIRDGGLLDDCYVLLMNRNRATVMVRFEDSSSDDTIAAPAADMPLKERDRTIVFQA
jgi:hypothetical protein